MDETIGNRVTLFPDGFKDFIDLQTGRRGAPDS